MSSEEPLPQRIRAFVALGLNAETIAAIGAMAAEIKTLGADVAWVKPANFHLTLRFLGDQVDIGRLDPLTAALAEISAHTAPFTIAARGIGAFPDWHSARVVWVGLESPQLPALAAQVEDCVVQCGFERERRPYTAHLTIGRVRGFSRWRHTARALKNWAAHDFGASQIESMTLYRSVLASGGSQYQALAELHFG
jgi:2'-5' RNA ligase